MANLVESLVGSFEDFSKSATEFSWALGAFTLSQGARVLNGLPTSTPPARATQSFDASSATLKEQLEPLGKTVFDVGNTVQRTAIGLGFQLLKPESYNPRTVIETTSNLVRWGAGFAAQLIPGGAVGDGGPPTGWGPVNREDAELFKL